MVKRNDNNQEDLLYDNKNHELWSRINLKQTINNKQYLNIPKNDISLNKSNQIYRFNS